MAEKLDAETIRRIQQFTEENAKYMPPSDWSDKEAWIRCHTACLEGRRASKNERYKFPLKNRFKPFPEKNRGRIWFPGCGLSEMPVEYAERGCDVLATDFSPLAVAYQKELREMFLREREQAEVGGTSRSPSMASYAARHPAISIK